MPIQTKRRIVPLIAHLAAWVCFFTLPYLVFFPGLRDFSMSNHQWTLIICNNVFLVLFYYLNTQVLIPRLLMQEKWALYVLAILVCLLFFLYVPRLLAGWINPPDWPTTRPTGMPNLSPEREKLMRARRRSGSNYFNTAIFLLVMTVGTCITVVQRWLDAEQQRKESENEKLNTELSFLKAQVNPHFFFNTLNNIYSLAIVRSEKTAPAVLKLSSIMRYILTETERTWVPLDNEIEFIQNYIALQRVRLTDKVEIDFQVNGATGGSLIAPLLFIAFVENAFKYGVSTKGACRIAIALTVSQKAIAFTCQNKIIATDQEHLEQTGIGINNVKRRLALLYPEQHSLEAHPVGEDFIVNLSINQG